MNSRTLLEKYIAERNEFLYDLAENLEHPHSIEQVERILRATLHTLRDRLPIQQSFHVLSQLPVFLKILYIEGWKFRERPVRFRSIEEFKEAVKDEQFRLGERDFNWNMPSEEIISRTITSLRRYLSAGEIKDLFATLPYELHPLFV
jgi:uncharacterized protein (DUF2267 family)